MNGEYIKICKGNFSVSVKMLSCNWTGGSEGIPKA
jgi:hypothetical protein